MGGFLLLALAVYVGAHVAILTGLASRGRWRDAILAAVLPPLAAWWGWGVGMKRRVFVWSGALTLYAFGVALA